MCSVDNPYLAFSTLAVGERFVGRHEQRSRLLRTVAAGRASCAIIGLPRVGKSSLARFVLDQVSPESGGLPVWIGVGGIDEQHSILAALLNELGPPEEAREALPLEASVNDMLKKRLQEIRRSGRRVVAVFDEFDSVRQTLKPNLATRRLRELVQTDKYALTVMLVCRRDLSVIEEQIPELSNLANACQRLLLKGFDDLEFAELVSRGFPDGLEEETRRNLAAATGKFPVLAEEALMNLFDGRPVDRMHELLEGSCQRLVGEWEHLLSSVGVWDAVLDIARGGKCAYGSERDQLLDYGLITPSLVSPSSYQIPYPFLVARANELAESTAQKWETDAD